MSIVFLILLFGVSSAVLAAVAVGGFRLPARSLRTACGALLEFGGLWLICLLANLAIGTLGVMVIRSLTSMFLSIYLVNDVSVAIVSGLQAFVLQVWIGVSRS